MYGGTARFRVYAEAGLGVTPQQFLSQNLSRKALTVQAGGEPLLVGFGEHIEGTADAVPAAMQFVVPANTTWQFSPPPNNPIWLATTTGTGTAVVIEGT